MARIAGVNIPTNKRVEIALTYIHGIGRTKAKQIADKLGIAPEARARTDRPGSDPDRETIDADYHGRGRPRREVADDENQAPDELASYRAFATQGLPYSFSAPTPTPAPQGRPSDCAKKNKGSDNGPSTARLRRRDAKHHPGWSRQRRVKTRGSPHRRQGNAIAWTRPDDDGRKRLEEGNRIPMRPGRRESRQEKPRARVRISKSSQGPGPADASRP